MKVHAGETIGDALHEKFSGWYQEGVDTWFQKWENGVVRWVHPLFARTKEGRQNRVRLVEELSKETGERSHDFDEWMQEMTSDIPEECKWVVQLYQRRHIDQLGRRVCAEDYTKMGMGREITPEAWEMYWISKACNKAADMHGTSPNEVKALRKVVPVDGKTKKAIRTPDARTRFSQAHNCSHTPIHTPLISHHQTVRHPESRSSAHLALFRPAHPVLGLEHTPASLSTVLAPRMC